MSLKGLGLIAEGEERLGSAAEGLLLVGFTPGESWRFQISVQYIKPLTRQLS